MISEWSVLAWTMLRLRILSLIFLVVSLSQQGDCGELELVLGQQKACRTQNVTLTCIAVNSSDITFTVADSQATLQSDIVVLNTTVAMTTLHVRDVVAYIDQTFDVLGLYCRDSGGNDDYKWLTIYDDPEPVSNFSCVVSDWDVSMKCTWSHTLAERDTRNISVKWMDVYGCEEKSCSPQSDNSSCTIDRHFSLKTVSIVVTTSSGCGINLTQCFTVNTKTVVKPAGVVNITSQATNSTCVNVTWKVKKPIQLFKQFFKISYQSLSWHSEIQIIDNIKVTHAEICNLHPGTKYKLEVRGKPITEPRIYRNGSSARCSHCRHLGVECECLYGEGYWSDPGSDTVTTYTDVPRVSPRVEAGSWAWNPRQCKTAHSFRNVTIYWQPLQEEDKNGDLISYIVKFTGVLAGEQTKHVAPGRTWVTEKIRCDEPYNVTVQARNDNGSSPIQQYISIPASQKGVYPPEAVVEMSKTPAVVHVTWRPVHRTDIDHFSVFWCRKDNGECAINSTVQWKISRSTTVNVTKLEPPEAYMFGVSMATEAGNSGITWARCIYTKDAVPRVPSNVKVEAGIQSNALFVTWSPITCESGQPYVDRYKITCCHDNNCRFETTGNSSVIVQYLKSGVPYSVQVQGITKDNRTGDWSKSIKATPIDKPFSTGAIVAYVFAGVIGVAVLISVACFCRCCIRKLKAKRNPPIQDVTSMIEKSMPKNMTGTAVEVRPLVEESDSVSQHEGETYTAPLLSPQLSEESGFVEGQNNHVQDDNVDDGINKVEKKNPHRPYGVWDANASEYVHITTLENQSKALHRETQHNESELQVTTVYTEKTQTELPNGLGEEKIGMSTLDNHSESSDNGTELNKNEMQNKRARRVTDFDNYVKSMQLFEKKLPTTQLAAASSEIRPSLAPDRCKSVKADSVPSCGYITQRQAETFGNTEAVSGPSCAETVSCHMANTYYIPHDLAQSKKTEQLSDKSLDTRYVPYHVEEGNIDDSLYDRIVDNRNVPFREAVEDIDSRLNFGSMGTGYIPYREADKNIDGSLKHRSMETGYVPYREADRNIDGSLNDRSMETGYVPYREADRNIDGSLNDRSMETGYVPYREADRNIDCSLNDRSMETGYVPYREADRNIDGSLNDRSMETGYVPYPEADRNIDCSLNDRSMDTGNVPCREVMGETDGSRNASSMDTVYVPYREADGNINNSLNDKSIDNGYVSNRVSKGNIDSSLKDRSLDSTYVPSHNVERLIDSSLNDRSMDTGYVPFREAEGIIDDRQNDKSMDTGYVTYRVAVGNVGV